MLSLHTHLRLFSCSFLPAGFLSHYRIKEKVRVGLRNWASLQEQEPRETVLLTEEGPGQGGEGADEKPVACSPYTDL